MNITKTNGLTDTGNKLVVTSGGERKGSMGVGKEKVQTIGCNRLKDISYNTRNIANILQ